MQMYSELTFHANLEMLLKGYEVMILTTTLTRLLTAYSFYLAKKKAETVS